MKEQQTPRLQIKVRGTMVAVVVGKNKWVLYEQKRSSWYVVRIFAVRMCSNEPVKKRTSSEGAPRMAPPTLTNHLPTHRHRPQLTITSSSSLRETIVLAISICQVAHKFSLEEATKAPPRGSQKSSSSSSPFLPQPPDCHYL